MNYLPENSLVNDMLELLSDGLEEEGKDMLAFSEWLPEVTPQFTWTWPHLLYLQNILEAVARREILKLMIFMPPRHGKSEMTTIRFPVWWLERDPSQKVIIAAYNATLASKFSRNVRKIARQRISISQDKRGADEWETDAGGGCRACGVGSGITGMGGDLIIIDDPVKSRAEANSLAYRNRCYEWYRDDLFTRRESDSPMILIQTRWHEDDLAGRILAHEDDWVVVNLPALAEEGDALGREPGQALCPDRFTQEQLLQIKHVMGRTFSALYQQRPVEQEGGFFKRSWMQRIDKLPGIKIGEDEDERNPYSEYDFCRFWDKAGTTTGDYTVGVLMAQNRKTKYFYVMNVVRGKYSPHHRDQVILETAKSDKKLYGNVKIRHEMEPGSSGIDAARQTTALLAGFPVKALRPSGSKVVRAEPFQSQLEGGNIFLINDEWNVDYIEELLTFPQGKHDDQVDGSSGALNELSRSVAFIIPPRG
jgi:predicted phage terminase large subunit-like protein